MNPLEARAPAAPRACLESADADLVDAWDRLADRVDAPPFARPGWVAAWSNAGGVEVDPLVLRRDGSPTAILPLVRTGGGSLHTPTDWHTPVFTAVAADPASLGELARDLAALGSARVVLDFLDASDAGFSTLSAALEAAGYLTTTRLRLRSPFIDLTSGRDAYEQRLPSKRRSDLRRRRRRLGELGHVEVEISDGSDDLDALLDEGFAVEAAGWKGEQGTAITSTSRTRQLYTEAARWASGRGWLTLALLRVGGQPIAFDYCLEAGGRHYLLKTGYDPEFRAFAPGNLLRIEMIRRAFDQGLATYEFAGADEPWKREWTETTRPIVTLEAWKRSLTGNAMWATRRGARLLRHLRRRLTGRRPG